MMTVIDHLAENRLCRSKRIHQSIRNPLRHRLNWIGLELLERFVAESQTIFERHFPVAEDIGSQGSTRGPEPSFRKSYRKARDA